MTEVATKALVPVLRHYVVWSGPVFDDVYGSPVETRDPAQYKMNPEADYFRIYDLLELDWEVDGKIIHLQSKPLNYSPYYVPGGRILTADERVEAFNSQWRAITRDRDRYVVFSTRYRLFVALMDADVEFLTLIGSEVSNA